MGEAKRRRESSVTAPLKSAERRVLTSAADHLLKHFIIPERLHGACYYVSLALRHRLASVHRVDISAVTGFVRTSGLAWASHMWIELEGRRTDLALHYPIPPVAPGPLVIDGEVRAAGLRSFVYSASHPADGIPVLIDTPGPEMARRRAEHQNFCRLATTQLEGVEAYLAAAPNQLYRALQRAWAGFRP